MLDVVCEMCASAKRLGSVLIHQSFSVKTLIATAVYLSSAVLKMGHIGFSPLKLSESDPGAIYKPFTLCELQWLVQGDGIKVGQQSAEHVVSSS
jgi:hypothetical protein